MADEVEVPVLGMVQVGEAAVDQRTDEVQRQRRSTVPREHALGVGPPGLLRELRPVDDVPSIARELDLAPTLEVGGPRLGVLPGQPAQLNGELIITEGRYRAYGQNLLIENGRLLFQGQPDNPGLDIRAVRKIPSENLVVGVQLSGTLQEPDARVFSDPSLEESEAMSYLVTGRSLSRGSQSDSAQVAQALALYGLQKGSGVTDKIGDTLGLDEISIGSDWETSDSALMLGKQISDRLYLTYAVGLFDAISTVMLRYTLTRQLHLEAQSSSKSQAIDLIWEKELE